MPRLSNKEPNIRPSGGERVFTDANGRLWSAVSVTGDQGITVIFSCINDGRQSGRAISIDLTQEVGDVGDEILRAWLEAAPRIGRLT
jgi:hypothetical protein